MWILRFYLAFEDKKIEVISKLLFNAGVHILLRAQLLCTRGLTKQKSEK